VVEFSYIGKYGRSTDMSWEQVYALSNVSVESVVQQMHGRLRVEYRSQINENVRLREEKFCGKSTSL
jgi:hypothetical protein